MIEKLIELFISFFKVGSFSFGGAYSLIPLIEKEAVEKNHWLTKDEFLSVLGGVEIFPGAISIKFATYTGYKVAGIPGIFAANLGNVIIPAIGIILVYYFYTFIENNQTLKKSLVGIKYGIIGIILAVLFKYSMNSSFQLKTILFIAAGFILAHYFKMHPALAVVILGSVAIFI